MLISRKLFIEFLTFVSLTSFAIKSSLNYFFPLTYKWEMNSTKIFDCFQFALSSLKKYICILIENEKKITVVDGEFHSYIFGFKLYFSCSQNVNNLCFKISIKIIIKPALTRQLSLRLNNCLIKLITLIFKNNERE